MQRFSGGGFFRMTAGVLLSCLVFAGCTNNGINNALPGQPRISSNQGLERGYGEGEVRTRVGPGQTDRDDLMGRNQNPNLIVGHAGTRNYQVDLNSMRQMAKSVPGVENCRITLNGNIAYVTLDLKHNVTANEARNIEKQVLSALRQKLPRYTFHVTSHDGYHR